jgi:carbon storage regulator CsrA
MLVLSRKIGEQFNDNVCVTVTAAHGNRVQLGFSAPKEVSIRRQELERSPQSSRKKLRQSGLSVGDSDCDVLQ